MSPFSRHELKKAARKVVVSGQGGDGWLIVGVLIIVAVVIWLLKG